MAKLLDKLYNRTIEGKLTLQNSDDLAVVSAMIEEETGNKPTLFYFSGENIRNLPADILNVVKKGDIIIGSYASQVGVVIDVTRNVEGEEDFVCICFVCTTFINNYYWYHEVTSESDSWYLDDSKGIDFEHFNISKLETSSTQSGKFLKVASDGTIVPDTVSGGTKLYRHSFIVENEELSQFGIIVITNSNSAINNVDKLFNAIRGGFNAQLNVSNDIFKPIVYADTTFIYYQNEDNVGMYSLTGATFGTDTVTEL